MTSPYRIHLLLPSLGAFACALAWMHYRSPVWLIFLGLTLSWLSAVVIARDLRDLRGRLRQREGKCPGCGYDLRESKDRCPECGQPRPATP